MKYDNQLVFSDGQTPATTSTTASTNQIDTRNLKNQENGLNDLYLVVDVDTAGTTVGAGTFTIALRSSAASGMSGPVVAASFASISLAAAKAVVVCKVPRGVLRYLDVLYTAAGTVTTSPVITAYLTATPPPVDYPVRID